MPARALALTLPLLLVYASCDAPRDPRHTLDHVRGRQLTVGVAEARPFIERKGEEASGIEADAIRGFAATVGAKVKWVWGAQEPHFEALHEFQLDMVAGGVTAKTPWAKKVAITRPFLETHEVLGCRRGAAAPDKLEFREVAVEEGSAAGGPLEKEKANVQRVATLDATHDLVAGSRTAILALGYVPCKDLGSEQLAFAAPPGENGFLQQLETYLAAHHDEIARAAGEAP